MTGEIGFGAATPEPLPSWRTSRWGISDAIWGWITAVVLGSGLGALIVSVAGYSNTAQKGWPLWLVAVTQVPLWIGLLGAPIVAARRCGSTLKREFGFRFEAIDVPIGLAIGFAAQFILVPAISYPWLWLLGRNAHDLSQTAEELVSKAHDPLGVVLLVAIVVVGAPFIEELFYRGLLFRSLQKLMPAWGAIVLCGLAFGASHFELLGLPALAAFGMLQAFIAYRTGRLGMVISAHMGFNALTVWYLLR